jgi:hypothetical protein
VSSVEVREPGEAGSSTDGKAGKKRRNKKIAQTQSDDKGNGMAMRTLHRGHLFNSLKGVDPSLYIQITNLV